MHGPLRTLMSRHPANIIHVSVHEYENTHRESFLSTHTRTGNPQYVYLRCKRCHVELYM